MKTDIKVLRYGSLLVALPKPYFVPLRKEVETIAIPTDATVRPGQYRFMQKMQARSISQLVRKAFRMAPKGICIRIRHFVPQSAFIPE